uniref:Uncharacterized protein n=1 Tax=Cyprinus carpio TaxID=7962 RepID=A0A8C2IGL7_CYPCA
MISSVQTFKRLYKIKTKMKTAFIVLVCYALPMKGRFICGDRGKAEIIYSSPSCKRLIKQSISQKCLALEELIIKKSGF